MIELKKKKKKKDHFSRVMALENLGFLNLSARYLEKYLS